MHSALDLQPVLTPVLSPSAPPATILEGFASHVAAAPEGVALAHGGRRVTYRELDAWSNRLARWIAARADLSAHAPRIPFALAQGPGRVAVLLAILKIGGAYVPIEPGYPAPRIRRILDDLGADFIVTESALADVVRAAVDRPFFKILDLDREQLAIADHDAGPLTPEIGPDTACYVMYTSGSTGAPKGVVVPHRAVVRLCVDADYMAVRPEHCFAQIANVAFDAATWEIWGALLNGARVALIEPDAALATAALGRAIAAHGVTHVFLTTALWNQHVAADPAIFAPLAYLLFGGEAASPAAIRQFFAAAARPRHLVHVYGPTENTTYSTAYELVAPPVGEAVPIGRAIAGSSCHVVREVDGRLEPAAPGERGELLVGGVGLAHGYLHDEATTRAKFVECAFAPGERLYRTGDLVEALPTGDLVFVGRVDNQIKLRGFRIELEEIELALAAHPAVGGVVVLLEDGPAGHRRLVATLVPGPCGALPTVPELRAHLERRLPSYMVPAAFVRLPAFPLGLTGKVDRRAVRELPRAPLAAPARAAALLTATGQRVRASWARALGLAEDELDADRDLFELGADSLLAVRVVAELRRAGGVALGVTDVFRDRTVARLAARVDAAQAAAAPPLEIPQIAADRGLPLSFAQEQVWMHQQMTPDAAIYNEPLDILIPEALDLLAFERALDLLLARHEALRARVELVDGCPTQRIAAHEPRPLAVLDLRHLPPADAEAEALRRAEAQARRPFDLAGEPLLRALLVRLADDRSRLFMVGHHLVLDGVTMFQIFLPELEAAYRDLAAGRAPTLPPVPLRFRDVVAWTRAAADTDRWAVDEAFWRDRLAGAEQLVLPLDRPRGARPSAAGARRCFALAHDLARGLRELAAQRRTTLFATLLAAFKALLFRYSQQRDLTVASVVATRGLDGLERVAGNFLNTVLLRTEVPADGSFLDLLTAVERTCVDALEHAAVPFQRVARARETPIRAAFVLEPTVAASAGGWHLGQHAVHTATTKFDLTFELDERPDGIVARVEYSTELFEADTIARMIGHFERLLASVVADPDARLTALELLGPDDRRLQLETWQPAGLPPPAATTLHRLVEAQVDRSPDAIAVVDARERLTYRQLDARANQLARRLVELGAGPEVVVGVWTERSADHAVALLAVLKAGAAYLPLGNADPAERVRLVLADAAAALVVVDAAHARRLAPGVTTELCLDAERPALAGLADTRLARESLPEHLAYVIYTSGTTGRPKGVLVEHRQIVRRIAWGASSLALGGGDVLLHLYALAFDAALLPVWYAWAAGATMVIPGDDALGDPPALARLIRGERVTHVLSSPPLLDRLLDADAFAGARLRCIQTGGEALSGELAGLLRPHCERLINAYGPTEATILASFWDAGATIPARPPIGKAVPGTRLRVLSAAGQLMPVGAVGELHIGGDGVARGYLGRPELTERLFVRDPFAPEPDARMYRTGDLVRWLPTGDLEFLGRADRQVKHRGRRLELDEVEAVLRAAPGVRAAAVSVRDAPHGRARLVAYVVLASGDLDALAATLRAQLPGDMVPAAFVALPGLPLTANGKLDVAALPEPARPVDRERVAPRSDLERVLAAIWRAVLRTDDLSVTDDFFDLGGDSLASLTVVARAAAAGVRLTMRDLLERRSIARIAEHLDASADPSAAADDRVGPPGPGQRLLRLRVTPASSGAPLFLVHPAGGSAFGYRELVRHLAGDRPVYGLECTDGYAGKTLASMAAGYVEAARAVQPRGPYLLGGWSLGGIIAAEMARQLEAAGEAVALVVQIDARPAHHPRQRRYLAHMLADDAALLALLARHLGLVVGRPLGVEYDALRGLPAAARDAWLLDRVAGQRGLAEALGPGFVRRFLDDFVAAAALVDGLHESRPVRAPMLLLRASVGSAHYPGFPALEEPLDAAADPTYGWGRLAGGGCEVQMVPGTHEDLLFGANARALAGHLSRALLRLEAGPSSRRPARPAVSVPPFAGHATARG